VFPHHFGVNVEKVKHAVTGRKAKNKRVWLWSKRTQAYSVTVSIDHSGYNILSAIT
jgi:ribosomal protein L23